MNSLFSLTKVYPTLFLDRGAAWVRSPTWRTTAGLEFTSRILLLNKVSMAAVFGAARRITDGGSEVFGQMILEY